MVTRTRERFCYGVIDKVLLIWEVDAGHRRGPLPVSINSWLLRLAGCWTIDEPGPRLHCQLNSYHVSRQVIAKSATHTLILPAMFFHFDFFWKFAVQMGDVVHLTARWHLQSVIGKGLAYWIATSGSNRRLNLSGIVNYILTRCCT